MSYARAELRAAPNLNDVLLALTQGGVSECAGHAARAGLQATSRQVAHELLLATSQFAPKISLAADPDNDDVDGKQIPLVSRKTLTAEIQTVRPSAINSMLSPLIDALSTAGHKPDRNQLRA